jgi:hypothetical protein
VNGLKVTLTKLLRQDRDHIQRALWDLVDNIGHPNDDLSTAEMVGNAAMLSGNNLKILQYNQFMIARDRDLLLPDQAVLPTSLIRDADIIAVPWAKFWSWNSLPGSGSSLGQPAIVFAD